MTNKHPANALLVLLCGHYTTGTSRRKLVEIVLWGKPSLWCVRWSSTREKSLKPSKWCLKPVDISWSSSMVWLFLQQLSTRCQHHPILSKHSFCLIYDVSYDFLSFILHSSDRTGKIPAWRSGRLMSCWWTSQSEIFSFSSLRFPLKFPNQRTQVVLM